VSVRGATLNRSNVEEESICMPDFSSPPGADGIFGIIVGTLAVSAIITEVTGTYSHWPFVLLGLIVGLMAVKSINR
jgi:hypothetical protein